MTHPKGRAEALAAARTAPVRGALVRAALGSVCALALTCAAPQGVGPSVATAQEAASAVQDVTLQDVSLPFGTVVLSAPKLTVSGTRLSKDELAAILKPDSAEPWAARLARLNAASLTIPELREVHTGLGESKQTVVYRDVAARDVRAGRIREITVASATVVAEGGPDAGTGSYGRIAAAEVDLPAIARLYGVAGDGKGPLQTTYTSFSMADLVFTDAHGTSVKLAAVEGRDIGGRQVPGGLGGIVETLSRYDPDSADSVGNAKLAAAVADLIEGVSAGSVEARGLSVTEAGSDEPLTFTIGRITYADPRVAAASPATAAGDAPKETASFAIEDISMVKGATRSHIRRIGLAGFSLAPTVATLRRIAAETPKADPAKPGAANPGAANPGATKPGAPEAEPASLDDHLRRLTPLLGTLTLDDLSLDLPAPPPPPPPAPPETGRRAGKAPAADPFADAVRGAARAKGAEIRKGRDGAKAVAAAAPPLHVALRNAQFTFGPPREGVPTASRLAFTGLSLPSSAVADVPGLGSLASYGYGDLDLAGVVDSSWDEARREIALREISVTGKEMGTVRLTGTIGGIGPEMFDPDPSAASLAVLSATAKSLDLTLENTGLFERFIAAQSKVLSLKPEELRQEYVSASTLGVPVILGNSPAAKAIGAAMGQFVTKPGRLTVSAKAKDANGVGMADFSTAGSPGAMLDKLDVTAKAE